MISEFCEIQKCVRWALKLQICKRSVEKRLQNPQSSEKKSANFCKILSLLIPCVRPALMIASREWKDWSKYSIWLFLGSRLTGSDAVLKNKLIPPFLPWLKSQWQFHNEKKKAWKREGSWSLWHPTLFARSGKKWPIILVIGFSRQRPVNRTKEKPFS